MVTVKLFGTFRLDSGIKEMSLDVSSVKDIFPIIMEIGRAHGLNSSHTS